MKHSPLVHPKCVLIHITQIPIGSDTGYATRFGRKGKACSIALSVKCVICVNSIFAKGNNNYLVELSSHRTPLVKLVIFMSQYIV